MLLSSVQRVCLSTVWDSICMGLMTRKGGISLRCGWYSTTTMEAGVHRQAPQAALALPSLSHVTSTLSRLATSHISLRDILLHT